MSEWGLERVLVARGVPRSTPIAFRALPETNPVELARSLFRLGRPLVPLHARWTRTETEHALGLVPEALVLQPDEVADLLERARSDERGALPDVRSGELAAIVFTSGTNGTPKAVALERGAFEASARASARNLGWRDDDRWLLSLPFAHIGGLSVLTRTSLAAKPITLASSEPEAMLEAEATLVSVVPTQLRRLLEVDRHNRLARFRAVLVGGAEFPEELREEASRRGIPALATYGLTETCSQVATQSPADVRDPHSLDSGRALEGVELRISGGRIQVRGPMTMRGYLGSPHLPAREWFTTGDLGSIDERGRLFVLGRADDVIITGGENVHPSEVERALSKCSRVKAALCFGVPDARWGEIVGVALVLGADTHGVEELEASLAELAPFKRPRCFTIVKELPQNGTGKPDRRRARRELAREMRPWQATSDRDTM